MPGMTSATWQLRRQLVDRLDSQVCAPTRFVEKRSKRLIEHFAQDSRAMPRLALDPQGPHASRSCALSGRSAVGDAPAELGNPAER